MDNQTLKYHEKFKSVAGKDYAQNLAKIVDKIATEKKLSAIQILTDKNNTQAIYDECVKQNMGLFEVGLAVTFTLDEMAMESAMSTTIH
jgi:uncharacterized protein YpbB